MKNKTKNVIIIVFLLLFVWGIEAAYSSDEFIYNDNGKRDPMWPLVTSSGVIKNYSKEFSIADVNVEGILYEPDGKSVVIISGNVLKEKDTLGPYVVSSIQKDLVILTKGDQKIELRITKE